jgi:cytochrome b6-f complex iron-sulfur subunit
LTAAAKTNPAPTPSRREFLNYAFGASIALILAGSCGGLVWFLQRQRIAYGEKTGLYLIDPSHVPQPGDAPLAVENDLAWLVNIDGGLVAFSGICPREGCHFRWAHWNHQFECPCCGSKFQIDGTYIEGPAKRSLDRLIVRINTQRGTITTPDDGSPVPFAGAISVVVDTDKHNLLYGQPRPPRVT